MSDAERQKWDLRYREQGADEQPSEWLVSLDEQLPREGFALDVGGGAGRNAIWLAQRGLRVWILDISDEGLRIARHRAADAGVAIETWRADLETEPLPAGPWDLVISFHYLQRSLFEQYPKVLKPGGLLVCEHPTVTNLERHERPSRRYCLENGELPQLAAELEVQSHEQGWLEGGRHDARIVARR